MDDIRSETADAAEEYFAGWTWRPDWIDGAGIVIVAVSATYLFMRIALSLWCGL